MEEKEMNPIYYAAGNWLRQGVISYLAECQSFIDEIVRIREKYRDLVPSYNGDMRRCVWYEVFNNKRYRKGYKVFSREFWTLTQHGIRVSHLYPAERHSIFGSFLKNLEKVKIYKPFDAGGDWRDDSHDSYGLHWETFFERLLCELLLDVLKETENEWFVGFRPLTKEDYDAAYSHLAKKRGRKKKRS